MKNKQFKFNDEFEVGKHKIGYLSSTFKEAFEGKSFQKKDVPKFQKLPRSMNDAEIESDLKPGFCELGDILAFLDAAPEECGDGKWNIFYSEAFVVDVYWFAGHGAWRVSAWGRDDGVWFADSRVFSPATESSDPGSSALERFVPLSEFLEFKKKVEAILKI